MKIAFIGFGIEGESAYRYYSEKYPNAEFTIYDSNESPKRQLPENVTFHGGINDYSDIRADAVFRTPSVSPDRITTNGSVTTVTNEFFLNCKLPIIGVTGTKGKGTTASLIATILENAGIKTWLVGNIGLPALDVLNEVNGAESGVVVYELSSFQLWDIQRSPDVAVILTIEPEHLDIHKDFDDYIAAKANIVKYQTSEDSVVFFDLNKQSRKIASASPGRKMAYDGNIIENGSIVYRGARLLSINQMGLKGPHNLQNVHAALLAASCFTNDAEAFSKSIRDFKGLPHRIEELGMRNGVLYVNDSFSSAPPAVLAAVRSYDQPVILIMGGYDRGIDYAPLVKDLIAEDQLKMVCFIGQTGPRLQELFARQSFSRTHLASTLEKAFGTVLTYAEPGDAVLLSPGCASFDMFRDFTERGEVFKSLVANIQREFVFEDYSFDPQKHEAVFSYSFDGYDQFHERVSFAEGDEYDEAVLNKALVFAFLIIGTSYWKLYPGSRIKLKNLELDDWQAQFLNAVYQEGMSQYAFENGLARNDLAHFRPTTNKVHGGVAYAGNGIMALQSGGKDSLLTATLLEENGHVFDSLYIASRGGHYPNFIKDLPGALYISERLLDIDSLKKHMHQGALGGHVPVTFIVLSLSLIQAILLNKNTVAVSIGHEGEEPHEWIDDLAVTHQWSKTWKAEQLFAEYIKKYISPDIRIGSPLRRYTELKIAELFAVHSWEKYGSLFSSCNVANYQQGNDNSTLSWCGECPKCANSYLLFAPFVAAHKLQRLFGGQDLFANARLERVFKGLLGIDGIMKPFECVGEVDELRYAYRLSQQQEGYRALPFDVPESAFNYEQQYPAQAWAAELF